VTTSSVAKTGTPLRALQSQLHRRDEILRSFFDESGLMYAVCEIVEDEFRYLMVNPAAAALVGRTPESIEGLTSSQVGFPRSVVDGWLVLIRAAIAEGKPLRTTYSASTRKLSSVIIPLPSVGAELPRFGFITEDVSQQLQLKRHLELAERRAMVGSVAAGAAHEIKNPLSFIVANVLFAREQLAGWAREHGEVLEALEQASDGLKRIGQLSDDLLALSREGACGARATDANAIIHRALALTKVEIRKVATTRLELDELPEVMADETRLEQVLLNLVLNAVDAMRSYPRESHRVTIRARIAATGVAIEVEDTGPGVAPENFEKIFQPFFSTKGSAGNGLGLSLSAEAIASMGGSLTVFNNSRAGATFRILLPLA
jgi:signal transduction histidine kinase